MVKVVREYACIMPDAFYDMMKDSKNVTETPNGPGIILSTVMGPGARNMTKSTSIPTLQSPGEPCPFGLLAHHSLGYGGYASLPGREQGLHWNHCLAQWR